MKTKPIEIKEEERLELNRISRSQKTENRIVTRARIILHSSEEKTYEEIMKLTNQSRGSVAKWRKRFIK